ncbi:anoctamin-10 [Sitophilus oryzae]|uniref:Anoctamin n=1 Tax=Sitophilus oryzae TaxID=7048 RepID=A0A6J2XSJ5_SITOR|nr:anoctamin-10 [Sitophilus oryzae]XP_030753801.1 anoctamin-10 [Sitophilus oryzae]XP_030753802.1 anoctamin-10 [Sitophilus oryzae]
MGYASAVELADDEEQTQLPPTYVVVKVVPDIHERALQWLVGKIRAKKSDGGGELVIMMEEKYSSEQEYTFHISATKIKLLEIAEELELIKRDAHGKLREFTVAQLDDFLPNDKTIDDLLTLSDKQTLVTHELENIRASSDDKFIPGYPLFKLYDNQAIIPFAQNWGLITKIYPLHEEEALKKLAGSWYMPRFMRQPIEDIRNYFGETIALYFAFLEYYTLSLVVPVILGLLGYVFTETVPFFCAFNVVWVTLFLELWKRKSNSLAYNWGTIGMTSLDEPRPGFRGVMGVDAVTGKVCPQSPRFMTTLKMYLVSLPIVAVCMVLAFYLMLISFWVEEYMKEYVDPDGWLIMIPSVVYSLLVTIVSAYFRDFATYLTEWENHRTQSQFERHRVTKLVLFEFVNQFLSLFYIAFIMKDISMLRSQLKTMLIISQGANHFQEVFMPLTMNYYYSSKTEKLKQKARRSSEAGQAQEKAVERSFPLLNIPQLPVDDPRISQAENEGNMEEYQDTFDDYLELYIQFGYVFLFSSVYPIAALWALINNVLEIRADAYKICKLYRRPTARRVKDIGAWQRSFEVLGGLSIMTNCGVLYLSPDVRMLLPDWSEVRILLLFICLAQFLLGVRYFLHIGISDKPEWVRVALARKNYESRQALKFERSQRNKKILYRFRTIHGTPARRH